MAFNFPDGAINGQKYTADNGLVYVYNGQVWLVDGVGTISSLDTRYTLSGSVQPLPAGLISGSSQLTSSYDTRYTLSGSISAVPAGTISGSSQLTASFDSRYVLESETGSLQTSITNLNSFSASENTKASTLASYTASVNITTSSLNAFTSSINSWTSSFSSSLTSSITSVSGAFSNLTINGQPTTYGYVNGSYLFASNNTDQGSVGNGTAIAFQTTNTSNGSLISKGSNTQVTLTAGNAYKLEAIIRRFTSNSTWGTFRWYDVTNSTYVGVEAFGEVVTSGAGVATTTVATYYVTPSVNTTYELRQTTNNTITVNGGYASYEITQLNPSIAIQATATGTTTANLIKYTRSTQQTGLSNGSVVICNVLENSLGNLISANTSTGQITLTAGKTYRLIGMVPNYTTSGGNVWPQFCWYNETTAAYIGNSAMTYQPSSNAAYGAFGGPAEAVITTNTTTIVSFRLLSGASGLSGIGGSGDFSTTGSYPWVDIQEIGSTFALNALDTMQISGSLVTTGSITSLGGITGSIASTNGVISGSSQLTSSYDIRYTLSGSVQPLPSGLISGSSQLTASFDTRYALSGSGGGTIPAGTVSGSSQLTSSLDLRYLVTGSVTSSILQLNTFTASNANTSLNTFTSSLNIWSSSLATTGSNSFNGNQTITGSLNVSSVAVISSSFTANSSSLTLNSGSNFYLQNNGIAQITGSLNVSGSTTFTGSISISSGSITMPNRPGFRVYGLGGPTTAITILSGSMTIVDYNQGGWDNTTGTFTAPIAGLYQVNLVCRTNSNSSAQSVQVIVYKNNTTISPSPNGTAQVMVEWAANTTTNHIGASTISKLAVGDTLKAIVTVGTASFDVNDNFSVAYIG